MEIKGSSFRIFPMAIVVPSRLALSNSTLRLDIETYMIARAGFIIHRRRKRKAPDERERNGEFAARRSVPALDTNNLSITRPGD